MAHYKMNAEDDAFLQVPREASLLFAGAAATETWIERSVDTVVRLSVNSVAIATADGGTLEVVIDVDGAQAKGRDGPAAIEGQLRARQGVQVLVRAGEKLAIKAYVQADNAVVMRTIAWAADLPQAQAQVTAAATAADASHPAGDRPQPQPNGHTAHAA